MCWHTTVVICWHVGSVATLTVDVSHASFQVLVWAAFAVHQHTSHKNVMMHISFNSQKSRLEMQNA
jgi:hypothetical protein